MFCRYYLLLTFILAFMFPSMSSAEVYKWVDKEGIVHYSDTPQQNNATMIAIRDNGKAVETTKNISANSTPKTALVSAAFTQKLQEYSSIIITQPTDQENIHNTGGEVSVTVSSSPALHPDHKWQVLLDGKLLNIVQTGAQFKLQGIERGEHKLQIQALDAANNDRILGSSNMITFYVHQATVPPQ